MNYDELEKEKKKHSSFVKSATAQNAAKTTIVINAFAGAGAGKTTACLEICEKLKKAGYVAEYVQEYPKELVWEENMELLDGTEEHQYVILQEQMKRQDRLIGKVDFCVTDSPLLLNCIYDKELTPEYQDFVSSLFNDYTNFCFYVERDPNAYEKEGRIHSLEESLAVDEKVKKLLSDHGIYYGTYNHATIERIVDNAVTTLKKQQEKSQKEAKKTKAISREEMEQMSDYLKSNVSIVDLAADLGYTPIRRGQKYFSLKEHDSVMIDTGKNCFWRNSDNSKGASGSVIDFVMYFANTDMPGAYHVLYEKVGGRDNLYRRLFQYAKAIHNLEPSQPDVIKKVSTEEIEPHPQEDGKESIPEVKLPEKDNTMKNVFAYLTKTRAIPYPIVQEFVDRKMLYQDSYKNCVFVSYKEDKPVYGCKRGTNTFKRFVADCAGNDYSHGFSIQNLGANKLYIAESVIDGMSKMAMLSQNGIDYHEYNWHFLTGTRKTETLLRYLDDPNIEEITIGVDNDEGGHSCAEEIEKLFSSTGKKVHVEFPQQKDWNLDLCNQNSEPNPIQKKTYNPIKTLQAASTLENKKALEMG